MKGSYIEEDLLTGSQIIYATTRKNRPFQDTSSCPFCVGSQEVPALFHGIKSLENKYPALHPNFESEIGQPGKGLCEVILYGSDHDTRLRDREISFISSLIRHWIKRDREIQEAYPYVKYIFPFENYGRDIGISLDHPHGQLYAFPFIPQKISNMIKRLQKGNCSLCSTSNSFFTLQEFESIHLLVPKFAKWPWEIYIVPKNHYSTLSELTQPIIEDLARGLKQALSSFYSLFEKEIPYILSVFQAPVGSNDFHVYIQLISPQISEDRLKYRAGVETSLDVFINTINPEFVRDRLLEVMNS